MTLREIDSPGISWLRLNRVFYSIVMTIPVALYMTWSFRGQVQSLVVLSILSVWCSIMLLLMFEDDLMKYRPFFATVLVLSGFLFFWTTLDSVWNIVVASTLFVFFNSVALGITHIPYYVLLWSFSVLAPLSSVNETTRGDVAADEARKSHSSYHERMKKKYARVLRKENKRP